MTQTREVAELTNELRTLLDSNVELTAEQKEKIYKIETKLDTYEAKQNDLMKEVMDARKLSEEMKEAHADMEKKLYRMPKAAGVAEKSAELKAFEKYVVKGDRHFGAEEAKYLRTDNDPQGGYLAPTEYVEELIKNITEISPLRQVARIRRTTRESVTIPRRTTHVQGGWVGEGGSFDESNSTYGLEEIKVNKLAVYTVVTTEMLTDAAFNMESEINQDLVEGFAEIEGRSFVSGTGVKSPQGILTNSDINVLDSGVSNDITADSLIELTGELKSGYQPSWLLNRRTLSRIRRLKDGYGQYIWQPGLADGQPNMILGHPYVSAIDMPDIAANAKPIAFGDFMRGYTIVDNVNMSMIRDSYTQATAGKVRFIAHRRVGGQVVLPEAIKLLRCAA